MKLQAFDRTIFALRAAGSRPDQWQVAIDLLAEATGSRLGEFVHWSGQTKTTIRLMTKDRSNTDEVLQHWQDVGGSDPRINPMIAAGAWARPLELIADTNLISADRRRRHILWNEIFDPFDIPHIASLRLDSGHDPHMVIGVLRTRAQGPIEGVERRILLECAKEAAVTAAFVRKLGADATALSANALEAVGAAAILFNRFGMVIGVTPGAEAILRRDVPLRLRRGMLSASDDAQATSLRGAIAQANAGLGPAALTLHGRGERIGVTVLSVAHEIDLGCNATAIAVLEDQSRYAALTAAEDAVLALLREGLTAAEIARERGVSRETVRSQIKSIYAKLDVRRQAQLCRR